MSTITVTAASAAKKFSTTTPGRLKLILTAGWIIAALVCVITMASTYQRYHAVKTIGVDAAPSVVAAQEIKVALATLDVDVANELIAKPGAAQSTLEDFNKWTTALASKQVDAAQNITYGDAEKKPILAMQTASYEFFMAVQQARDAHNMGNEKAAIAAYEHELSVLNNQLLPQANNLEQANSSQLDATYANQHGQSWIALGVVCATDLAMVALLFWAQLYLRRRFHRNFNPLLAGATALSIAFLALTVYSFGNQMNHLREAKQDSYDSVIALLGTKSEAYLANAAESRYLLDPDQAQLQEQYFFAQAAKLANFQGGMTFDQALVNARAGRVTPMAQFSGLINNELSNITFQGPEYQKRYGYGEGDVATAMLAGWQQYILIDHKIRQLETSGQHQAALTLCLGTAPGQSNYAFAQFDSNLDKALTINEGEMNRDTALGFSDLALLPYAAPIVSLLLAGLLFFGIRPRLREYDI